MCTYNFVTTGGSSFKHNTPWTRNTTSSSCPSSSVAMVVTDVFQINWFSMRNKIGKIAKIFGKIEDPENRGVI
jgi:hypothetical protein